MLSLIKCVASYTKWDENKLLLKSVSKFLALNLKVVGVSPSCIRFLSFRYHIKALVISGNQSFISQLSNVVGPLGKSSIFSFPWDLKFKALLITKSQKLSFAQAELSSDT